MNMFIQDKNVCPRCGIIVNDKEDKNTENMDEYNKEYAIFDNLGITQEDVENIHLNKDVNRQLNDVFFQRGKI